MTLGIAFDLDDTLYLERDYVKSGFRAVAAHVAAGDRALEERAFGILWQDFVQGVRGRAFNRLLAALPELEGRCSITELVACYREHTPAITFLPGVEAALCELRARGARLAVISDGPLVSQAAKAAALGVARYADPVILTDAWGQRYWKPHARAFEAVAEAFALPPERLVYVGDNPEKDFHAPARLGWRSVRLRLPEQVRHHLPHEAVPPTFEVTSVAALREQLLALL
ncbi:HAD family hydrolase [Truepera radiovictrix]|uniref:Haloacid dehalogenase domain protein hydrolase n=1 Tax=Truepera radiovictrix (strain DSM 17093 / CIP 108686 / LMG 22925 / RQ-24) TaxID=649638 RepID=D7CT77_TRURR|nr:HAD family hydrolase [Truepera radiovictrix]ADI15540.1 Haloacid dehalogenase domain protein hydrolase [Truepera radiovictrix DSM 17093]WMT55909.1 HAD family hydrolase [Truepera radiovictrix]